MKGPIFIAGLAFSGKTPVRIALNAHPRICLVRHVSLWPRYHRRFGDLARGDNLQRCLDALLADERVARLEPDRERLRRDLAGAPPTYGRLFGLLLQHHAERQGGVRWGEQAQGLERYADAILGAHPDARIIHMLGEPEDLLSTTARRRSAPGKRGWEVARWSASARLARAGSRANPTTYRVVRTTALATEPERVLRDLAAFVGEGYDPAMLAALHDHRLPPTAAGSRRAKAVGPADEHRPWRHLQRPTDLLSLVAGQVLLPRTPVMGE